MARIIVLSSFVARGHVGLRALVPALERLGHEVVAIPTVILSSHAAFPHVAGSEVATGVLEDVAGALDANGWLAATQAIVTGYLPTAAHVHFAAAFADHVRQRAPGAQLVCDPVLGDGPKGLYVAPETAAAIRSQLIPRASLATPNRFELAWLTGHRIAKVPDAVAAARALPCETVLATSIPHGAGRLATLLVTPETAGFTLATAQPKVPSGTGDYLTGLFVAETTAGRPAKDALAMASAFLQRAIAESGPSDDLCVVGAYEVPPAPLTVTAA
ncbi:MAG: PfkB family carbohydrate kinase [Hyphomicrobium sp.]|nr:PfkB family carbohydrate kinase [Hyphomicrobium sp.]